MKKGVSLKKLQDGMHLECLTPGLDLENRYVTISDINRPALPLSGFWDYFDKDRVEIMGLVETAYLEDKNEEEIKSIYRKMFSYDLPCVIYCRDYKPQSYVIAEAMAAGVPLFCTDKITSEFVAETIYYLTEELAPCITMHGVLVDVYGEGLLITGESGIGKSEAALELIHRGHRLVSDDVVEIRKIAESRLVGSAPDITRHFIELRGIGIIDVKTLFGVECVKDKQGIDLVIRLEDWQKDAEYDRLGLEDEYTQIMGVDVTCHTLPIRPGRNLAIICESAAVNHRQKKMGYNAAKELYRRVEENIAKSRIEG